MVFHIWSENARYRTDRGEDRLELLPVDRVDLAIVRLRDHLRKAHLKHQGKLKFRLKPVRYQNVGSLQPA